MRYVVFIIAYCISTFRPETRLISASDLCHILDSNYQCVTNSLELARARTSSRTLSFSTYDVIDSVADAYQHPFRVSGVKAPDFKRGI